MTTIHPGQAPDLPDREHFCPTFPPYSDDAARRTRVLLVNGAPRSDGSWSGEAAKTWRLTELARQTLEADGICAEVLDLGLLPASGDLHEWIAAIRARCLAAHGIIVLTPANWRAMHAMLQAVFEGDTRQLAERAYGILVHGDAAGVAEARCALAERLDELGMVDSDSFGPLTRYAGYHDAELHTQAEADYDEEARNVARAVHKAVTELRAGRLAGLPAAPYRGAERRAG